MYNVFYIKHDMHKQLHTITHTILMFFIFRCKCIYLNACLKVTIYSYRIHFCKQDCDYITVSVSVVTISFLEGCKVPMKQRWQHPYCICVAECASLTTAIEINGNANANRSLSPAISNRFGTVKPYQRKSRNK